jgi:hypothetical protein
VAVEDVLLPLRVGPLQMPPTLKGESRSLVFILGAAERRLVGWLTRQAPSSCTLRAQRGQGRNLLSGTAARVAGSPHFVPPPLYGGFQS